MERVLIPAAAFGLVFSTTLILCGLLWLLIHGLGLPRRLPLGYERHLLPMFRLPELTAGTVIASAGVTGTFFLTICGPRWNLTLWEWAAGTALGAACAAAPILLVALALRRR